MLGQFLHSRDMKKGSKAAPEPIEPEEKATDFEHDEVVRGKNSEDNV
jgi:hypothetical protein